MTSTTSKSQIKDERLAADDQNVLSGIGEIIADMKAGKPVIIVDDEDRENEGDLIIAAEMATAESINFMAKEGRGLICLPMEEEMVDRLGLELMGRGDNVHHRTAFTVSIEAKEGVTTGISAADRATTIRAAINPQSGPNDIATPGHVFPLKARKGGVLIRAGHTEAAVDLAKMAGFSGAGVICEIMNDDGTMARLPDLLIFAQRHGLKIGTIADLIAYRRQNETLVEKMYENEYEFDPRFRIHIYKSLVDGSEHLALTLSNINEQKDPVNVRMHSVDPVQDLLCNGENHVLAKARRFIIEQGQGAIVLIYGGNIQKLLPNVRPDSDEAKNNPSESAPLRRYGIGAQILLDLGVRNMRLLTSSPKAIVGLEGFGLAVDEYKPL